MIKIRVSWNFPAKIYTLNFILNRFFFFATLKILRPGFSVSLVVVLKNMLAKRYDFLILLALSYGFVVWKIHKKKPADVGRYVKIRDENYFLA